VVLTTESTELVETSELYRKRYREEAKHFNQNDILRLIKLANELEQSIRWAPQPRFKLEAGLLQMIKMERSVQIDTLLRQIDELKKKLDLRSGNGERQGVTPQLSQSQPAGTSKADAPAPLEVRVVGQVQAGRLRSAAAYPSVPRSERRVTATMDAPAESTVSTSRVREAPQAYQADSSSVAHGAAPFEHFRKITLEEAYTQWQQWVGEVRRVKIGVGTILGETCILEVLDDSLRIGCPDDYHLSSLKRHKEFLVDTFQKVTGFKLRIEPVLHNGPVNSQPVPTSPLTIQPAENVSVSPPPRPTNGSAHNHPVIEALKRELGAERVE